MLTVILIMVMILAVFFGILAQKPLPAPERVPIQPDTKKERELEKDERQRRREDHQERRDDSDSGIPDYRYAERLKYGQKKDA